METLNDKLHVMPLRGTPADYGENSDKDRICRFQDAQLLTIKNAMADVLLLNLLDAAVAAAIASLPPLPVSSP